MAEAPRRDSCAVLWLFHFSSAIDAGRKLDVDVNATYDSCSSSYHFEPRPLWVRSQVFCFWPLASTRGTKSSSKAHVLCWCLSRWQSCPPISPGLKRNGLSRRAHLILRASSRRFRG